MWVILQRELLRASRRAHANWPRLISSLVGFSAALFLLLNGTGGGSATDGRHVFLLLTGAGFFFSMIQGVRFAAGSIADEKRDGTLPLLLLTPLRPIGIVAGKFFAAMIPLLQPFLACIPALAITALLGGVTGAEILRAISVIAITLLLSIAAGLFISSFSRKNDRVGQMTILFLAAPTCLPLPFDNGPFSFLKWFSPVTAFLSISEEHYRVAPGDFWIASLFITYLAFTLLLLAIFYLPKRWNPTAEIAQRRATRMASISTSQRTALLDRNPGEWLAMRESNHWRDHVEFQILIVTLSLGAGFFATTTFGVIAMMAAALAVLILAAARASFPLCNARRAGAMELLLSTPLDPYAIIAGQFVALRKELIAPLFIVVAGGFFFFTGRSTDLSGVGYFALVAIYFVVWTFCVAVLGVFVGLLEKSPATAFFQTMLIGIIIAGVLAVFFPLLPFLLLLGFCGNRLASDELPKLLKRSTPLPARVLGY